MRARLSTAAPKTLASPEKLTKVVCVYQCSFWFLRERAANRILRYRRMMMLLASKFGGRPPTNYILGASNTHTRASQWGKLVGGNFKLVGPLLFLMFNVKKMCLAEADKWKQKKFALERTLL